MGTAKTGLTVILSQELPLHAEDGVDDLLLLARHGEAALASLSEGEVVKGV